MKEIKIVKKYRYGEHPNCDKCLTEVGCKMDPSLYGCALTEDGEWIGFIKSISLKNVDVCHL